TKSRYRNRRSRPRRRYGRRMRKTRCRRKGRRISRRPRHTTYRRRVRKIVHLKRRSRPRDEIDNLKVKNNRRLNESLKQHRLPMRVPV
uniref:Spermatid-specific protein S1 n=1 Tax=Scyliorhinus canicula TaxID=7830 RepID=SSS1_SCYCA|nr:RecName: Full=Spermatid-specific protein S1 [Scyliorhinus canicula]